MKAFTEPSSYIYAVNVKLSQISANTVVSAMFPNIEDLLLNSKSFDKFEDAVDSSNKLIAELVASLNATVKVEQFASLSEINPKLSGTETISKDWAPEEMAKLWIIDQLARKEKTDPIRAVGLAQLLEVPGNPVRLN